MAISRPVLALGAVLAAVSAAQAADLTVTVTPLRNAQGNVRVAVCTKAEFLASTCALHQTVPATAGEETVVFHDVAPGLYAVQAHHDENGNGVIDRTWIGIPEEGIGFSNKATRIMGRPDFADSAFTVTEPATAVTAKIFYYE